MLQLNQDGNHAHDLSEQGQTNFAGQLCVTILQMILTVFLGMPKLPADNISLR